MKHTVKMRKLDNIRFTVEVEVSKELILRLWMARQVIKLLSWTLTGTSANVNFQEKLPDSQDSKDCEASKTMGIGGVLNLPPEHRFVTTEHLINAKDVKFLQDVWKRDMLKVTPIPMLLFCPKCNLQHVDTPHGDWKNPPHRSHLCDYCGYVWRPSDAVTTGVLALKTSGQRDRIARPH